jgi:predicted transcriptional regulator
VTDGELEILQVLWKHGGRTVREICDALEKSKGERPSPEAVLTRLDIMSRKGLARRDDNRSPKVFFAAVNEQRTQRDLLRDFMKRVFGGSSQKLVMRALDDKDATPEELEELTKRLNELRGKPSS